MVTEFQLIDNVGNVIAHGEIDNDIYRLFSNDAPAEYEEFEKIEDMFAKSGGASIQPMMFQTPARTRQLNLLGGKTDEGNTPPDKR